MKITDVRAHVLAIPIRRDETEHPWIWGDFNQIVVVVETNEGITGFGEAYGYGVPHAVASVINDVLSPMLSGADPTQIAALQERMYRGTHLFGRYGVTTFAISGVDIALWDIAGKRAGLPLYSLLGGAKSDSVPAYASLARYPAPETVSHVARRAMDEGYKAIKVHQVDVESVCAARGTMGDDLRLIVDCNCPWDSVMALDMARRFEPYNLYWLEEPIWPPEDFRALAELRRVSGMRLAAGENACTVHQFHAMLEAGAVNFIQPSVIKVGGVTEWLKVAALADAYNVVISAHSPYHGPGLLATAHLIAATQRAELLEYFYVPLEGSVFKEPPEMKDGRVRVPQGPGLGLEIDRGALERYAA
jgi:D-galactarolactone cycloisomerase